MKSIINFLRGIFSSNINKEKKIYNEEPCGCEVCQCENNPIPSHIEKKLEDNFLEEPPKEIKIEIVTQENNSVDSEKKKKRKRNPYKKRKESKKDQGETKEKKRKNKDV